MIKTVAIVFGIMFLAVGIFGFIPALASENHLLGIFHVNTVHNVIHILTGLAAVMAGLAGEHASKLFFRIFGIVYGLVAILGFVYGEQPILGVISSNMADTWLHVGIAAFSLFFGFVAKERGDLKLAEESATPS